MLIHLGQTRTTPVAPRRRIPDALAGNIVSASLFLFLISTFSTLPIAAQIGEKARDEDKGPAAQNAKGASRHENPALASSNREPSPASREVRTKSVEEIAAAARDSVVVVTQFGRDGDEEGVGAGFVVASDGLIATCLHVIGEGRPISVRLADGRKFDVAEVTGWDRKLDLALIRIKSEELPALPLGDSDGLKQGASVVAIGNPLGLERSIVEGVVSAKRDFDGMEMIQLAIPIEPGNSGGPLLDRQGRVHGLLTMKSVMSPNLGFAMPINALKPLLAKPNPVPIQRWMKFGTLDPKRWTALMGARWTRKSGYIQVEGVGSGFGGRSLCLSALKLPDDPYEVAVTVRLDDEAGAAGLAFESDGDQKHYGFYPTGGQLRLTRFDGPTVFSWNILSQIRSASYHPGEWNELKVRVEKNLIRCFVNGQQVIETLDNQLRGGKAGLAKFRNTKAEFKDFRAGRNLESSQSIPSAEFTQSVGERLREFSGQAPPELLALLRSHPQSSRTLLADRARQLEQDAAKLRELARTVHAQAVQAELTKVLAAPEDQINLFHAGLLVAKFDNPDLDVEVYRRQIAEMAAAIRAELPSDADDAQKLSALKRYLFEENGFHGSRADYYNRANSYLNDVLDDREGLPITLSVLFLELARQIGLEQVAGIALPRHFVVKHTGASGREELIDVFDGGKAFSREAADELVLAASGRRLSAQDLKAATKRDIIVRMLRNLLGNAERDQAVTDSLRYLDLILAVSPDSAPDRLDRALLRVRSGDTERAKADLKWILEKEPAGIDLERISELLRSLKPNNPDGAAPKGNSADGRRERF